MLLIWGLRVYFWTIGRGTFHCQKCGGDRRYRHRSARRFVHVFFIPLIPLNKRGELVQCDTCKTRYPTSVLALPTMDQMQQALPAGMQAAAITMLRSGDAASAAACGRAVDSVRGAGLAGYDDAALRADLEAAAAAEGAALAESVADRLGALSRQLEVPAREWFLAEVIRIGLADGALTDDERGVARELAAQLVMTPAQTIGVIIMTEQAAAAG